MATIILPGKKSLTVDGRPTLGDLKAQGVVPGTLQLVRKDANGTAVRQLQDHDTVGDDDLVFSVPRHVQGEGR